MVKTPKFISLLGNDRVSVPDFIEYETSEKKPKCASHRDKYPPQHICWSDTHGVCLYVCSLKKAN